MPFDRSRLIITEFDTVLTLFFDNPGFTLVGYWWYAPPDMKEMAYMVIQPTANEARHRAAARVASDFGGTITMPEVTPWHVLVFRVSIPLPAHADGGMLDAIFAQRGSALFLAMCDGE